MATETPVMIQCGDGWCVETPTGMEGPLESKQDAASYLKLLNLVNAARIEMACLECEAL